MIIINNLLVLKNVSKMFFVDLEFCVVIFVERILHIERAFATIEKSKSGGMESSSFSFA